MRKFIGFIQLGIVTSVLLTHPASALARGGGGGGHGGGGGGGHFGGMHGGPVGGPGFHGGFGPGYHSAAYRTAGWGYPGYYGWGYPYFGYGMGMGLGVGLGYGLSAGYGYPYYGYGYGAYGNGAYYGTTNYVTQNQVVAASGSTTPEPVNAGKPNEFAERGFNAFKSADYEGAAYAWRHAVVDDPRNAVLVLELAQALFAIGKYEEAAGATQAAMHQLPQDEWGTVVTRFKELYGNSHDYTKQLHAMEKAIKADPNNAALRFLAGYHYGYLGFHKQSLEQLERAVQIESRDEMAKKLRDVMRGKLGKTDMSLPPPPAPAPEMSSTWIPTK